MKKITSHILLLAVILQQLFGINAISAKAEMQDIYVDISKDYNSVLYTNAGVALGSEKGSGRYFPGMSAKAYNPESAVGTGIDLVSFKESMHDGVLTTSSGSQFKVDTSGAVMMGYNGFTVWEPVIEEKAFGIDILILSLRTMHTGGFSITAYYDDGTIEDDCSISIKPFSAATENSAEITGVNAVTGVKNSTKRYVHVLSMDFKNQYTNLKKVTKIRIEYGDSQYGLAFMALTLKTNPKQYDYSKSVCMDISEYCNGEYASSADDELKNLYSGFLYSTSERINYDYIEKLTNADNRFMYDGVAYQLPPKEQQYKAIFTQETPERQVNAAIKPGYYDKICMLVNTVSYDGEKATSQHSKIKDIPVEIVYSDGTSTTEYINVGYSHARAYYNTGTDDVTPAIIAGSIQYEVSGNKLNNKTIRMPNEYRGFIYSAEVPVRLDKPVVRVRVGSENKWVYMYSLTGLKKENTREHIEKQIMELTSEESIYDTMYPIVSMTEEMLCDYINNGGTGTDIRMYDEFQKLRNSLINEINSKGYIEIFVSDDASGNGKGSEQNPVASIKLAKEKVQENKAVLYDGKEIHVVFAEGNYSVDSTYFIEREDGTDTGNIIYCAKDDDSVCFTGTRKLSKSDFVKVTDNKILERLPDEAAGKVYQIELDDYGITVPAYTASVAPILFADGTAQKIAQYPNDGYTSIESDLEEKDYSAEKYTQVKLYDDDCTNFNDLSGAFAEGYFEYDYDYKKLPIVDFDSSSNILTVEGKNSINCSKYKTKPRRLRIVNTIEALDTAGEWYYDNAANIVYWYPKNFDDIQNISITDRSDAVFRIHDAKNITIKNIKFSGNVSNAIEVKNSENILIDGCEFTDIDASAIVMKDYKNTTIRSNKIYNCSVGIEGKTGNFETLENYGNSIVNNYIYNIGYGQKNSKIAAIKITDVGCRIVNNTICDMPGAAVVYSGNDIYIAYNEIYDVCREVNDGAAIYSGNKYIERGSVIEYNYFHDILPQYCWSNGKNFGGDILTSGFAVYFDDNLCSQTARKNIIVNVASAADINGGQFNTFEDNIIVNTISNAFLVTQRGMNNADRINREKNEWETLSTEAQEIYKQKYPELKLGVDYCSGKPANNIASNNLLVDTKEPNIQQANYDNNGVFENNVIKSSEKFDGFSDSQKGDYRIKSENTESDIPVGLVTVDTLSMFDVGSTLISLAKFNERVNELTKEETDTAYEVLRTAVLQDKAEWKMYLPIVNKKGETGKITINKPEIINNVFGAVINIADINNKYSYDLMLAVYDNNNRLVDVYRLHRGENETITDEGIFVSEVIGDDFDGRYIKCFAWDSLGKMQPLSECIVK